ncbi:AI-2E family transporter [uncultured Microbacterium sp.]|uniref:AI-2E family transporter n=1 Tax=uncultured Microbacterium sp. TaxID=191216 RepID=UPI0025D5E21F|nr:AI-2E family transporter [uncultured Microbacterium sp.]
MTDATAATPPGTPSSPDATRGSRVRQVLLARPFAFGFLVTLGGLLAFVAGLAISNLSTVIIYIAFALFAALGLDPIVGWLERHRMSRGLAIVTVLAGFAVLIAGVLMLIIPILIEQISQFVKSLPHLISDFQKTDLYHFLADRFGSSVPDMLADAQKFVTDPNNLAQFGGGVFQVGVSIVSGISGAVIVLVLTLYFTASLQTMKNAFYRLLPAPSRRRVAELTEEITQSVGGYLMGMVVLAFCNAVVTLILYLVLQLPFPALMAVVSFCITLIPLVGSVLFWITGSAIALFASPFGALIFAIVYIIYIQLEAYVLTPKVMNRTISIPGSLVVIGALVGGTLLGLLGALVAIPVTASVLLIIKKVLIPKQDAKTAEPEPA